MNIDKVLETINGTVVPHRYDLCCDLMDGMYTAYGNDVGILMGRCFRYGFLQGQKAARGEARREQKQRLERDTTGWYAYLSRWLERNIDNERLLGLVGTFARKLEAPKDRKGAGSHG